MPETESLADCAERLLPFLHDEVYRDIRDAIERNEAEARQREVVGDDGPPPRGVPTFVISSSENAIRALVKELDGLADDEMPLLDIPYATPLVYQLDAELKPIPTALATAPLRHGYYLGDESRIRDVQRGIRDALVCDAGIAFGPDQEDGECDVSGIDASDSCFVLSEDGDDLYWVCEEPSSAGHAAL